MSNVSNLIDAASLLDCTAAAGYPHGKWAWTDPATGRAAYRGDPSGIWESGQLIAPPDSPDEQPSWLDRLTQWREGCKPALGLDTDEHLAILNQPSVAWSQQAYVHVQMHPFDTYFFDRETGEYTVGRWLEDLRTRFGGVDAALLWPTYPILGIDDRNAYDMIRAMPGGLDGLRSIVAQLHEANVRVLWPLMPWDTATRFEGPEPAAMVSIVRETGADGVNGDTLFTLPEAFWAEGLAQGHPVALQAELGGSLGALRYTTLGWAEAGGWSLNLSRPAPAVDLFKCGRACAG